MLSLLTLFSLYVNVCGAVTLCGPLNVAVILSYSYLALVLLYFICAYALCVTATGVPPRSINSATK